MNYQAEFKMTHKPTLKVQKKIKRVERNLAWLLKQSNRKGAADRFGVSQNDIDALGDMIGRCLDGANRLHNSMTLVAAKSDNPGIVALGPGDKDEN